MGQINDNLSNFVFGKVQPQATQLEEAVLGALMLDREAFGIVCDVLRPESFYLEAHQHIYRAILNLSNSSRPVDLLTTTEEIKANGNLEKVGGGYYLVELSNRVASAANIEQHARIIAQKHIQRELIGLSTRTIRDAYEDTTDVFALYDEAMAGLMGIMSPFQTVKHTTTVGEAAMEVLRDIDRAMSGEGGEAVLTGIKELDRLSGGFFPGELTIIAARPGMGKTEIALCCAEFASLNERKAHFVTLEMTSKQLARRLMSSRSGVPTGKIRRVDLGEVEIKALKDAAEFLQKAKLSISSHRTISGLWQFVRRAAAKKEIDILFVDYAQLMQDDDAKKGANREQEISAISRTLKRISTEFNIPVVLLAQLSREVEKRADKMPQLSDLRESGSLEQDADNVYFLVRLDTYGIFEYTETYDNVLPAGNYPTAGTMLVYSKKFRSDSQFGTMLGFVGGHIVQEKDQQPPAFQAAVDFTQSRPKPGEEVPFEKPVISRQARMNDEDIPF